MNRIATDLKGITNWIFDLDDTLYPSSEEIFNQMAKRIKSFIMQALNVGEEEAFEIQKEYYKQYGATVRGLMLEHNIAPESFTDYVHELDLSCLKENPALKTCLDELPGKKYVFTNGAYQHAERVTERLGIRNCFDGIFSIREAAYLPKPAEKTYRNMLKAFNISPQTAIMFDDSQTNLKTAHDIGMKTVWITTNKRDNRYNKISDRPDFCDYQTDDLVGFLTGLLMDKTA